MTFLCNGCEKEISYGPDYGIMIITIHDEILRYCRSCRTPKAAVPDVYWDGKPEINLADDPNTGKPRVFGSKAEKAAYLKERGLIEAGDRKHGAPIEMTKESEERSNSRDEVRKALQKVRNMGQDVRRQEYLKLIKERQRYA